MTADPAGPPNRRPWSLTRWLTIIVLVIAVHVALIWVFGQRHPTVAKPFEPAPSLTLAAESTNEWLALNDATLFALPDRNGFAGPEWIALPPLAVSRQPMTEPPQWLSEAAPLPFSELGAPFDALARTNRSPFVHFEFNQPPALTVLETASLFDLETNSALRIEGPIAKRRLLTPMKLPSWPFDDVIAPSVVQVLVNGAGNVLSAVLLSPGEFGQPAGPRDPDADQRAVELAHAARFAPLARSDTRMEASPAAGLTLGQLIFNWQTVPVSTTNAAM